MEIEAMAFLFSQLTQMKPDNLFYLIPFDPIRSHP